MKGKLLYFVCVFVLVIGSVLPVGIKPVSGQVAEPPQIAPIIHEPCFPGQPCQDEDGNWYMLPDSRMMTDIKDDTKSTGGPDDFGYTWDDSVAYSWIDASDGTNVGFDDRYDQSGPISLPFDFPFYENTYSEIYIVGPGYLTFHNQTIGYYNDIPDIIEPNDFISPYAMGYNYSTSNPTSRVTYKSGGTAPNRYFLAEWYQVQDGNGEIYTFEVILYENGNILFQLNEIPDPSTGWYCSVSGIENSTGLDGLAYKGRCDYPPSSNTAVLFTFPPPSARVSVSPIYMGEFTQPQKLNTFEFTVTNTGEFGNDTYDLDFNSSWPVTLFNAATSVALADSDGDFLIDTGPIAQGDSLNVLVRFTTPGGLTSGSNNTVNLNVTSSLDITKTKTVRIDSTIPAPFAQTYSGLQPGKVNLDLNWANLQKTVDITSAWSDAYFTAVAETPDHNFINVWDEWKSEPSFYGYILQYALNDRYGKILQPISNLTALYGMEGYRSYDGNPAISVASDGKIGITWISQVVNGSDQSNYNVWFAILNPAGDITYGPVNLTNSTIWANYGDENYIQVYAPTIAATSDNHFMISWNQIIYSGEDRLSEVYYSIFQSNGSTIVDPTKIDVGIIDFLEYRQASVTSLSGDRFFITYGKWEYVGPYWIVSFPFRVYDSSGNILKSETDTFLDGDKIDAVQLSGGNILISNVSMGMPRSFHYAILNGSTYSIIYTSPELVHPSSNDDFRDVSVTKDNSNRGIVTWNDEHQGYLYYALINSNGTLLNEPSIYQYTKAGETINLSSTGYGITTNSWVAPANVEGIVSFNSNLVGAAPGGSTSIGINIANEGLTTATNASLSLTLGNGLTYNGDSSGITPSIIGNIITWDLPDLAFGDRDYFNVNVTIPAAAPIGTLYSLDLLFTSDGPESDPTNNTASAQVMSAEQVFLPALMK